MVPLEQDSFSMTWLCCGWVNSQLSVCSVCHSPCSLNGSTRVHTCKCCTIWGITHNNRQITQLFITTVNCCYRKKKEFKNCQVGLDFKILLCQWPGQRNWKHLNFFAISTTDWDFYIVSNVIYFQHPFYILLYSVNACQNSNRISIQVSFRIKTFCFMLVCSKLDLWAI